MEQLIRELTDSASRPAPDRVQDLQKQIQSLQRADSGWQLGADLLRHNEANIRFYGALTLVIKIHAQWDSISDDDLLKSALLEELVNRYSDLTNACDQSLVLQKLSTALSVYFLKPSSGWRFPIRNVFLSIAERRYAPVDLSGGAVPLWNLVETLTFHHLRGVLWLCLDIVEEASRIDLKGTERANVTNRVLENGDDVWQLIYVAFQGLNLRNSVGPNSLSIPDLAGSISNENLLEVTKVALQVALAWMKFAPPDAFENHMSAQNMISSSLFLILNNFTIPPLTSDTLEVLTGLVHSAPKYLKLAPSDSIHSIVNSEYAASLILSLRQGIFDSEPVRYVEFLVSLVSAEDLSSPNFVTNHRLDDVLAVLVQLMSCPGAAVVEDEICQIVLEAFNQIAEGLSDWVGMNSADIRLKPLLRQVCFDCVIKMALPLEEMDGSTQTWDNDDRTRFQEFRQDVRDFLLSAFSSLGPSLLDGVASVVATNGHQFDQDTWQGYEAGLYALSAFSDIIASDPSSYDKLVSAFFESGKWESIKQNSSPIPDRARHGVISFISQNTGYLKRHPEQTLLSSLNFLFYSLQLPGSTSAASRAIYTLCDAQRPMLVESLPSFISTLTTLTTLAPEEKHRIFGAVAAIIQAIPTEDEKIMPLTQMVHLLSRDFETSQDLPTAIDLLETLAAVGKGLRAPADTSIDLENTPNSIADFWRNGPGQTVQQLSLGLFNRIITDPAFGLDGQIIEAACDFIKSGFTEDDPSPFKFSPHASAGFFFSRINLSTPNLNLIMATASAFLASFSSTPDAVMSEFVMLVVSLVDAQRALLSRYSLTQEYFDHEFTYSSLDFLVRLLPKYGSQYFAMSNMEASIAVLFDFALLALENPDTLPRRSSAAFWATIWDISGYPSTLSSTALSNLNSWIQAYAPRFIAVLLRLLGGECARSELDALAEPLRKFVGKHGMLSRGLLGQAIRADTGVLTPRALAATDPDRRIRFVAQVERLRGARKTTEMVRDFWVDCRGSAFGYTA